MLNLVVLMCEKYEVMQPLTPPLADSLYIHICTYLRVCAWVHMVKAAKERHTCKE